LVCADTKQRLVCVRVADTLCVALELLGANHVHKYIGREPSGRNYNELALNADNKPHSPFVRSGAILATSLIKATESIDRVCCCRGVFVAAEVLIADCMHAHHSGSSIWSMFGRN
jgi:glutaminase